MDVKQNIANNIIKLRKKNRWTQADLADRINYSDKAVSKWERAEAVPDIDTLYALAELFGVTVDYFLHEDKDVQKEYVVPKVNGLFKKMAVLFLCSLAVLLVALVVFMTGYLRSGNINFWLAFVWATPLIATFTFIFFKIIKVWLGQVISCSFIVITLSACAYLTVSLSLGNYATLWMIWLITLLLVGAVVLFFFMKRDKK